MHRGHKARQYQRSSPKARGSDISMTFRKLPHKETRLKLIRIRYGRQQDGTELGAYGSSCTYLGNNIAGKKGHETGAVQFSEPNANGNVCISNIDASYLTDLQSKQRLICVSQRFTVKYEHLKSEPLCPIPLAQYA